MEKELEFLNEGLKNKIYDKFLEKNQDGARELTDVEKNEIFHKAVFEYLNDTIENKNCLEGTDRENQPHVENANKVLRKLAETLVEGHTDKNGNPTSVEKLFSLLNKMSLSRVTNKFFPTLGNDNVIGQKIESELEEFFEENGIGNKDLEKTFEFNGKTINCSESIGYCIDSYRDVFLTTNKAAFAKNPPQGISTDFADTWSEYVNEIENLSDEEFQKQLNDPRRSEFNRNEMLQIRAVKNMNSQSQETQQTTNTTSYQGTSVGGGSATDREDKYEPLGRGGSPDPKGDRKIQERALKKLWADVATVVKRMLGSFQNGGYTEQYAEMMGSGFEKIQHSEFMDLCEKEKILFARLYPNEVFEKDRFCHPTGYYDKKVNVSRNVLSEMKYFIEYGKYPEVKEGKNKNKETQQETVPKEREPER